MVQVRAEEGQNPRCWLWACLTGDAVRFRVDPSRSAAAAAALFGKLGLREKVVLVCDRYAAYVKLAREHPEQFELSVCWAHARRDFVTLGRKRPDLQEWVDGILERIGRLYRRNAERLAQWDPHSGLEGQSKAFRAAQQRLAAECAALFEHAEREVATRTGGSAAGVGQGWSGPAAGTAAILVAAPRGPGGVCEEGVRAHGQQCRGASPAATRARAQAQLRLAQCGRRGPAGRAAVGVRHAGQGRHRPVALAGGVPARVCGDRTGSGRGGSVGLAAVGPVRGAVPGPASGLAVFGGRAGPVSGSLRFCGRDFSPAELDRIRALLAHTDPPLSRTKLSQAVCEALDWRKPDGGLKEMSARVALLRMQRDGWLTLPPPLTTKPRLRPLAPSPRTDPPPLWPLPAALAQARPLRLSLLRPSDPRSRLWNEFVERYHYLGYKPLPGAQLRYFVHAADGLLLALLGCGAAAWKTAPRDRFVGWDPATRQRNLPLVVNHARYLILPWIRLPSLASHLLACLQRQLPDDWQQRYGMRPVLLETFCETPRFQGTCYRAANWIHLGQTQGRGKLDTRHEYNQPVKNVFVKPLCPDWKETLNR